MARQAVHLPEAVVQVTREENAYADALNCFGCDPQDEAEHEALQILHRRALAVPATLISKHSTNFAAVLAAVTARGPRCDQCDGWTFHPAGLFTRNNPQLCGPCIGEIEADHLAEVNGAGW
jgi:hypothetical protein